MRKTRLVLIRDLLVGASAIVIPGQLLVADALTWWLAIPGVIAAVGWAVVLYVVERDLTPEHIADLAARPDVLAVCLFGAMVFAVVGFVLVPGFGTVALAAFVGVGVATLLYRLVYGVVLPVPEPVVERARRQTS